MFCGIGAASRRNFYLRQVDDVADVFSFSITQATLLAPSTLPASTFSGPTDRSKTIMTQRFQLVRRADRK